MRVLPSCLIGSTVVLAAVLTMGGGCRRSRFPSRGDAAAVVVVARRSDAAAVPKLAEQEPNDDPERAQLLALNPDWPLLSLDGSLTVSPERKGKDVDVFKLPIPGEPVDVAPSTDGAADDPRTHARRLSVELTAQDSDLGVQLLDEAAKPLAGVSIPAGETAGMPNLAVLPGRTYYVRVKAAKSKVPDAATSHYRLAVELGDFEVADEREPNDSRETATPVAVVGTVECAGYHGWLHDQDFFRVALPDVRSSLDVELSAVEGVGASLQVLDATGARLAYGRGRRDESLALRNVTLQPPPSGSGGAPYYYVVVRAETGQNRARRFVLRISIGAPREGAEVEPNDAAERATPVKDGSLTGFLPSGDIDYYRYQSDGPRDVTISVSFPARVRGKLAAWREGDAAAPPTETEAKKVRQTLTLPPFTTGGRPVIVRVSAAKNDGNASDPYTLNIASSPTSNLQPSAAPSPAPAPNSGGR